MLTSHTLPDAFSADECARLVAIAAQGTASDAALVGQRRDHSLRRADLVWLDETPENDWVMDRIIALVREANRAFGYDLTEFAESPQIARYGAEVQGHFDWHADIGDGPVAQRRKLTMVVQLTDAHAYEGGALELMPSAAIRTAPREIGSATLFPGFVLHRVTPVTRGARHSLTTWAHGPGFR